MSGAEVHGRVDLCFGRIRQGPSPNKRARAMKQLAVSGRFLRSAIVSVALLVSGLSASAQVAFDAASNSSPATSSNATVINVLWNHTTGLAKKPYIVVGVSLKLSGGGATVGSVTYGTELGGPNIPMTALGNVTNGTIVRAELWGVAGPTPGTHQI